MRRQQSGRSVSRLASRHRAAILSDIIVNEKLKLLQINYSAQKVDVLFNTLRTGDADLRLYITTVQDG